MMELLNVKDIRVGYGKNIIVKNISFKMKSNEFVGLLGLNGAGKTTLLKSLSGLLRPMEGECLLLGKNLYDYTEKERAKIISFMPQRHSIMYNVSVLDTVVMGITPYLGLFESPTKRHRDMAYEILLDMGIGDLALKNFLHLSEGQKQIIIIARNLMQNSHIMLFDEPDSALDFNNKHMVISSIKEVVASQEKAGIITLHDPNIALKYCDRIIILKDGEKISDFYTNNVTTEFLSGVFNQLYKDIEVIKHKDNYLIVS